MAFEHVHTVWDYYDGPRSGIAVFSGQPHHYSCDWDEDRDNYAETFTLTPINQETLALAIEQWRIWCEWEDSFLRGKASPSSHPGLPGTNAHYAQLEAALQTRISHLSVKQCRARATFRPVPSHGSELLGRLNPLEVEWTRIET